MLSAFEHNGVPAAPVRDTATAVRDDIVTGRGEVVPLVHPQFGHFEGLYGTGLPMVFSRSRADLSKPAPGLGQHTDDVLEELLGYDAERVAQLRQDGVL